MRNTRCRTTFSSMKVTLSRTLTASGSRRSFTAWSTWGVERTTFLIDEEGRIARIFPKVKVDGHVAEVTQAVAELG